MTMNWDQYFLNMAYLTAMKSKDPSTKVGAVIVGPNNEVRSTGFNGLARGVLENNGRWRRPGKYLYYEHAERNACYNAARHGVSLEGCTIYTQGYPCADCARAIIQCGLHRLVVDAYFEECGAPGWGQQWQESVEAGKAMLMEAGVRSYVYRGVLLGNIQGLKQGTIITQEVREGKSRDDLSPPRQPAPGIGLPELFAPMEHPVEEEWID